MRPVDLLGLLFLTACGGSVVFEEPGSGGEGGSQSSSSTAPSTSTDATGSTMPSTCTDTRDCANDEVCILETGECRKACSMSDCEACGPGLVCDACATSSCPGCDDCVGACVDAVEGRCDDDDPCPDGSACIYSINMCLPRCDAGGPCRACEACGTSSCCACRDCVDVCVPI